MYTKDDVMRNQRFFSLKKRPYDTLNNVKNSLGELKEQGLFQPSKQISLVGLLSDTAKVISRADLSPSLYAAAWFLLADLYSWRLTGPQDVSAKSAYEQIGVCLDRIRQLYIEHEGNIDHSLVSSLNTYGMSDVHQAEKHLFEAYPLHALPIRVCTFTSDKAHSGTPGL